MKYIKYIILLFALLGAIGAVYYFWYLPSQFSPLLESHEPLPIKYKANRLSIRPIIHTDMHARLRQEADQYGYNNINGPSLIRVPDWIEKPMGKYYLYFAHHKGKFLRLAVADNVAGPWQMYPYPVMPLSQSGFAQVASTGPSGYSELKKHLSLSEIMALSKVGKDAQKAYKIRTEQNLPTQGPTASHVASPEVIIDKENHQIRLYFHGLVEGSLQMTKVATSENGIDFIAQPELIGAPYMRVFKRAGYHYGFAMPGLMYRSKDGLKNWEIRKKWFLGPNTRHAGIHQLGNLLYVFFTRVGDAPERVVYTTIDMSNKDWNTWTVGETYELLEPKLGWEGGNQLPVPSIRGEVGSKVNQLRDPDIFQDDDGKLYLLYAGGGEQGIGIASLVRE